MDYRDAEFESIESFVEYLIDNDREEYTHIELGCLNTRLRRPVRELKEDLKGWGLSLAVRAKERNFRGFQSRDNNRWDGNPCGGGSGWDSIVGMSIT